MKKPDIIHKKYCRLCENKKLKTVYDLNPTPIGDDYVKNPSKKQKLYPLKLMVKILFTPKGIIKEILLRIQNLLKHYLKFLKMVLKHSMKVR